MGHRTELQREIVEALVSTNAINFDAVGNIIAKYGSRAALNGDAIGFVLTHRVIDWCIPVDYSALLTSLAPRVEQLAKPGR